MKLLKIKTALLVFTLFMTIIQVRADDSQSEDQTYIPSSQDVDTTDASDSSYVPSESPPTEDYNFEE